MKKILRIFVFIFLISGILFSCKKDKDSSAPKISILYPKENDSYQVFDTIFVTANITDETQLVSASVQLLEENLTPAQTIYSKILSGKSYDFKADYEIYEQKLVSGFYYLKISSSDGVNEAKEYVKIHISESAVISSGIVIVSTPSANKINVSILDENNTAQPFITLNSDYSSSCVSSKNQYLNILGIASGGLISYKISDRTQQWKIEPLGSLPYFEHLDFYNEISYVCYRSGNIRGYDKNKSVQFSATASAEYYPEKSFLHNTYLLVQEKEISGNNRRLAMYYGSGAMAQYVAISMEIISFATKDDDNILLFGNDNNGQGKIRIYKISENNFWSPFTIPAGKSISDAVQINSNTYMIALPDAVYKYAYSPVNFSAHIQAGGIQKIKYNAEKNTLVTASGNTLGIYAYGNGQLISSFTHAEQIRDAHLLFSK